MALEEDLPPYSVLPSQNTPELERLFELINTGRNILMHGPGGTGKTWNLGHIVSYLSEDPIYQNHFYLTASTGTAAVNMSSFEISPSTLHSWAGIKKGEGEHSYILRKVRENGKALKRWKTAKILIVDEISMLGKKIINLLDYIGKSIRKSNDPFGGLQVIFVGDFLQLPPVKDDFAFESDVWDKLKLVPFVLSEAKRYDDIEYFKLLLRARNGTLIPEDETRLNKRVKAYRKLIKMLNEAPPDAVLIKPTILYPLKRDVEEYNISELEKLSGKLHVFEAVDKVGVKENKFVPKPKAPEINSDSDSESELKFDKKSMMVSINTRLQNISQKQFSVKVGAQVMLKVNIDVNEGLVNGSRGVVMGITQKEDVVSSTITVTFLNGITRTFESHKYDLEDRKVRATRIQFPFILAWALTIHKCQGCTLDYAICDMGNIFERGQGYVALSRVRNLQSLFLKCFSTDSIFSSKKALEYVIGLENV